MPRLDRLLARLAAGPIALPKRRANNHSGPHQKPVLPTTQAWLIKALGAEAAAIAAQLEALLADPATADLLACTAARRTLAPIRRMLGLAPARPRRPAAHKQPMPAPPREQPPRPDPIPPHRTIDPPPSRPRPPWWLPPPRLRSG